MSDFLSALKQEASKESQTAEGISSVEQLAYIIDRTDPGMGALLRVLDELQRHRTEILLLRYLMLGCPDHPEYRPILSGGELVPNPHPDCPLCAGLHDIGENFKAEFLKELNVSIQPDGTT